MTRKMKVALMKPRFRLATYHRLPTERTSNGKKATISYG